MLDHESLETLLRRVTASSRLDHPGIPPGGSVTSSRAGILEATLARRGSQIE
jgi:hypothetical protein